jgi:beta-lactam-binding protein with PASTA domain
MRFQILEIPKKLVTAIADTWRVDFQKLKENAITLDSECKLIKSLPVRLSIITGKIIANKLIYMDLKKFWKESTGGFILKRVLLAIIVIIVLVWGALFAVDFYTHHGEAEIVPDLRGLYVEEAQQILKSKGLYTQVIDSVYVRGKKLGTIIEQIPQANSTVKKNRPVYLIINSKQIRKIPLPAVTDVSYRQASAMLKAIGIEISSVQYTASEYKDLVVAVKYQGRTVAAGARIPEGSSVILVVGSGSGEGDCLVPSLKGLTLKEAEDEVLVANLVLGAVNYDVEPNGNEDEYVIYRQRPGTGHSVAEGSHIDVWLSKDKSLLNKTFDEDENENKNSNNTDEEFF